MKCSHSPYWVYKMFYLEGFWWEKVGVLDRLLLKNTLCNTVIISQLLLLLYCINNVTTICVKQKQVNGCQTILAHYSWTQNTTQFSGLNSLWVSCSLVVEHHTHWWPKIIRFDSYWKYSQIFCSDRATCVFYLVNIFLKHKITVYV